MRKLLLLFMMLITWPVFGQYGNTVTSHGTGAPSGSCSVVRRYVNDSNGNVYSCFGTTWVLSGNVAAGTGTVTASGTPAQYDFSYWTTALNLTKVTAFAAVGATHFGRVNPTAAATAPAEIQDGLTNRTVTGTTATDAILWSDQRVEYTGSVAVAVSLKVPTSAVPTGLGNTAFVVRLANNTTGAGTLITVTPTTWTISGPGTPAAATLKIPKGGACTLSVGAGTDWSATDCTQQGVPVLISTSGPVTDPTGMTYLQINNAAGALTFNAPAGVEGMQRCYRNATTKTGAITIQMAASNTVDVNGTNSSSAGTLVSTGAAGDAACITSDATNHWYATIQHGSWSTT